MGFPRVHTGARAILKVDGNVLAYATAVEYDITTEFRAIQGVDNSLPEELAPTKIEVEVRCTSLRIPMESPSALALQSTILSHLHQRYVAIEVRDRATNDTLLFVPKAMLVRRTGRTAARQLGSEVWVFRGIGYWDERTPQDAVNQDGGNSSSTIDSVANLAKKLTDPF